MQNKSFLSFNCCKLKPAPVGKDKDFPSLISSPSAPSSPVIPSASSVGVEKKAALSYIITRFLIPIAGEKKKKYPPPSADAHGACLRTPSQFGRQDVTRRVGKTDSAALGSAGGAANHKPLCVRLELKGSVRACAGRQVGHPLASGNREP